MSRLACRGGENHVRSISGESISGSSPAITSSASASERRRDLTGTTQGRSWWEPRGRWEGGFILYGFRGRPAGRERARDRRFGGRGGSGMESPFDAGFLAIDRRKGG